MRIGIDAREAFRKEPRGIGLYVRHLANEFAKAPTHEFSLYHRNPAGAEGVAQAPHLRYVFADMPGDRFHAWERVLAPWRMRRDRLDVWHGPYNTLPPRWRAWRGPAMVLTLHDVLVTWWPDDANEPFVRYARAVTQRSVRDAAVIVGGDGAMRLAAEPAAEAGVPLYHCPAGTENLVARYLGATNDPAGIVAAIGTFLGGYLADVMAKRNLGWSAWVVTAAVIISMPFTIIMYLTNDTTTVLWLMTVTILVSGLYLAPTFALVQNLGRTMALLLLRPARSTAAHSSGAVAVDAARTNGVSAEQRLDLPGSAR